MREPVDDKVDSEHSRHTNFIVGWERHAEINLLS